MLLWVRLRSGPQQLGQRQRGRSASASTSTMRLAVRACTLLARRSRRASTASVHLGDRPRVPPAAVRMAVGVVVVVVLRQRVRRLGLAVGAAVVGVAVLVDDDRRPAGTAPAGCRTPRPAASARSTSSGGPAASRQPASSITWSVRRASPRWWVDSTTAGARSRLLVDDLEDALLAGEVEPGDRLVEQQQVGLGGQRLGDEHALALPAGELAERATPQVADVEARRRRRRPRPVVRPQPAEQAPLGRSGPCATRPRR